MSLNADDRAGGGALDTAWALEGRGVQAGTFRSPLLTTELRAGQLLLVTGPVGSGKSLVAESLGGIERPGAQALGSLSCDGGPVRLDALALVPQDTRLVALTTDVVGSTLHSRLPRSLKRSARAAQAARLLHHLGLSQVRSVLQREFRELSVIERRRVGLALALAGRPRLLVTDGLAELCDPEALHWVRSALAEHLRGGGAVIAFERDAQGLGALAHLRIQWDSTEPPVATPSPVEPPSASPSSRRIQPHPRLELERLGASRGRTRWLGVTRALRVVDGATLSVRHGEVVGLLGEGAAGKTSLLECAAGLLPAAFGSVRYEGRELTAASERALRRSRRHVQLVFQAASLSLSPQRTPLEHVEEAIALGPSRRKLTRLSAEAWLRRVGLPERLFNAPADQLSAGEAQRVDFARSLAVRPDLVLFDDLRVAGCEPADPLLNEIRHQRAAGTSFLITAAQLEPLQVLADRVAILLQGRVVEWGPRGVLLDAPRHPYTASLVHRLRTDASDTDAGLVASGERARAPRARLLLLPSADPARRPSPGCPYFSRCPRAEPGRCDHQEPALTEAPGGGTHTVACWHPL